MSETLPRIQPISETAVAIDFGGAADPDVQQKVLATTEFLLQNPFPGMLAVVPAYTSVTVFFQALGCWPLAVSKRPTANSQRLTASRALCLFLEKTLPDVPFGEAAAAPLTDILVRYGGTHGPDLSEVAERLQLTENEVIDLHTKTEYTVQMVGFLPGFPYLGPLPEALRLPRRDTPRLRVPPGSVAIAGGQTGIYPQASPGGWHLIGHTDFPLFDPHERPPARLQPGQRVRFVAG